MGKRQRAGQALNWIASPATNRLRQLAWSRPTRRAAAARLLAIGLAIAAFGFTALITNAARDVREQWDSTVDVLVARQDLEVGSVIAADSHRVERRPVALIPEGALIAPPSAGSVVTVAILEGEPLVEARVSDQDSRRTPLPAGRVALDIELTRASSGIGLGDHVDVLTINSEQLVGLDPSNRGQAPPETGSTQEAGSNQHDAPPEAFAVTGDAIVVSIASLDRGTVLTLAVKEDDVPAAAAAAMNSPLLVVKRNPDD